MGYLLKFGLMYSRRTSVGYPIQPMAKSKKGKKKVNQGSVSRRVISQPISRSLATIKRDMTHRFTVKNTERIRKISADSTGDFLLFGPFNMNPGSSHTFSWLAGVADQFEFFEFKKLEFHYIPTCPTTTIGEVCLSADFDPNSVADPKPASIDDMMVEGTSLSGPLHGRLVYSVPQSMIKGLGTKMFVSPDNHIGDGVNVALRNLGRFFVGTSGASVTQNTGRLEASYVVELWQPSLSHPQAVAVKVQGATPNSTVFNHQASLEVTVSEYIDRLFNVNYDPATGAHKFTIKRAGEYLIDLWGKVTGTTIGGTGAISTAGALWTHLYSTLNTAATHFSRSFKVKGIPGESFTWTPDVKAAAGTNDLMVLRASDFPFPTFKLLVRWYNSYR